MKLAGFAFLAVLGCGCSYGPHPAERTACDRSHSTRLGVTNELERGAIANALATIERANAECPETRKETRGDEVKLLAELGRCSEIDPLAATIEADADRADGAWLAVPVARARCAAMAAHPELIASSIARADAASASGDEAGARKSWDHVFASATASGLAISADCTRWGHRGRRVAAYLASLDAIVVVDDDHALALSTRDGHEVRYFDAGGAITAVATTDDGHAIAIATASEVRVWTIDGAAPTATIHGTSPLAFSPDGGRIAFLESETTIALARLTGEVGTRFPTTKVHAIGLANDALASATGEDGTTALHVVALDGKPLFSHPIAPFAPNRIIALGGGAFLVGAENGPSVGYIDVVDRTSVRHVIGGFDPVYAIARDGRAALSVRNVPEAEGSHDVDVVVDLTTGKTTDIDDGGMGQLLLSDGRLFGFDHDDHLSVIARGKSATILLSSASAKIVDVGLTYDGEGVFVDFERASLLSGVTRSDVVFTADGAVPIAPSPYSRMFADPRFITAQHGELLDVWSARSGEALTRHVLGGAGSAELITPIFSPSGRFVIVKTKEGHVRIDLERVLPDAVFEGSRVGGFERDDRMMVERTEGWVRLDPVTLQIVDTATSFTFAPPEAPLVDCHPGGGRPMTSCILRETVGPPGAKSFALSFAWVDHDGTKIPFAPLPGHSPEQLLTPLDGRYVALAYAEGSILFHGPHGGKALALRPFADGSGGYAKTEDGKIELFGDAERRAVCRVGAFSLPFAACRDRFAAEGALASFLRPPR